MKVEVSKEAKHSESLAGSARMPMASTCQWVVGVPSHSASDLGVERHRHAGADTVIGPTLAGYEDDNTFGPRAG